VQRIVTVLSTKGGTGKTTQTYNFAKWLGSQGHQVLLIDHDHQMNLSTAFGIFNSPNTIAGVYDKEFKDPKILNVSKNVDLIPGSMHLGSIGETLINRTMREFILYNWLDKNYETYDLGKYEYILLDSHPDVSIISKNAIMISNHVLSFVEPSQFGGFDAMDSLKARMQEFKSEAVVPRTQQSYVTADTLFVGNKVAYNTNASHEFRKSVSEMKDVVAVIPQKELFNRSTIEHRMIFEYEDGDQRNAKFFHDLRIEYGKIKQAIDKPEEEGN
jgi:chromosome partitioning protein